MTRFFELAASAAAALGGFALAFLINPPAALRRDPEDAIRRRGRGGAEPGYWVFRGSSFSLT